MVRTTQSCKRSKLEKAVIYAKTIKKHCVIIFRMEVAKYRIMQRNHCLFKAKDIKGAVDNTMDYSSLTIY